MRKVIVTIIVTIILIILVAVYVDAALIKTVAKAITKDTNNAKIAVLAKEVPASTTKTEEKQDMPKVSLAAAKAAQALKKKKTKEQVSASPSPLEHAYDNCAEEGQSVVRVANGGVQTRLCCQGLVQDAVFVCRRTCAGSGEMPREGVSCCIGLQSIGIPPTCVPGDRSCRQAGEPYSIFRRNCCEGLDYDEETLECKPHRAANARMPTAKVATIGCTAEQLTRIEQKLDELLSR